jgi:hypothetical protein
MSTSMLKVSYFSWCTEVSFFSILSLSFTLSIILLCFTNGSSYLYTIYAQNWSTNYITDLKVLKDTENCPAYYDKVILGQWTGFDGNGCYCQNSYTGEIRVFENKCGDFNIESSFVCTVLNEIPAQNITKYKGNIFCIQRSEYSFEAIQNELNYGVNKTFDILSNTDDRNYYNFVTSNFSSSPVMKLIDNEAITDIKILNTNLIDEKSLKINLSEYQKTLLDNNTALYIKKVKNKNNLKNLFEVNNFIVDIHLFNHLWCSYLDFSFAGSSGSVENILSPSTVNFGFNYCNDFYRGNGMFYKDDFKRTERINFIEDTSVSKNDFYTKKIIEYYDGIKVKFSDVSVREKIEPILIYEKYFSGIACEKLDNPGIFIQNFKNNKTVRVFSIFGILIESLCGVAYIFYFILKKKESPRYLTLTLLSIIILKGLHIFLSFTSTVVAANTFSYLDKFQRSCQKNTNMFNFSTTNLMEIAFKENFIILVYLNAFIFLSNCLVGVLLLLNLFGSCFCKTDDSKNDTRQVFELRGERNNSITENSIN